MAMELYDSIAMLLLFSKNLNRLIGIKNLFRPHDGYQALRLGQINSAIRISGQQMRCLDYFSAFSQTPAHRPARFFVAGSARSLQRR